MSAEYLYGPTDLEDELFLSEVPINLIQESIETQFKDPLEFRKKDYLQSFITKYEFSQENMMEDDLQMLELSRDEFMRFMEDIFERYLSVGFPDIEDKSVEDQHELVHFTYRFFIKNIKKNFVNIVLNLIEENRDEILSTYEKKKDVTTLNFKSEIDDEYDVQVISNLGDIVRGIFEDLRNLNDIDKFIELCKGDEVCLELEIVQSAINDNSVTGNFIEKYIEMIDDEFLSEIQSKVRNKILKKYPYREKKNEINEDSSTEELENNTEDETEE